MDNLEVGNIGSSPLMRETEFIIFGYIYIMQIIFILFIYKGLFICIITSLILTISTIYFVCKRLYRIYNLYVIKNLDANHII